MAEFSMSVADESDIEREIAAFERPQTDEKQKLKDKAENNAIAIMACDIASIESRMGVISPIEKFGMCLMS